MLGTLGYGKPKGGKGSRRAPVNNRADRAKESMCYFFVGFSVSSILETRQCWVTGKYKLYE